MKDKNLDNDGNIDDILAGLMLMIKENNKLQEENLILRRKILKEGINHERNKK